jgi:hypothetical protein
MRLAQKLGPWASLILSIVGAVWMDRSESQGPIVAASAAVGWIAMVIVFVLHRPRAAAADATGQFTRLARFASFSATQSLVQLSLFFSIPFYLAASAWTLPQCVFFAVFALAAAAMLWDPLSMRVFLHPWLGPFVMAFASFVATNVALPMLAVPQRKATLLSAVLVSLAMPLYALARSATRREWLRSVVLGIATPVVLFVGGIRAVPPAPLSLIAAGIGSGVLDRELTGARSHFAVSPGQLVCWTALGAPLGLHDALFHEWRHDGEFVARIELKLHGGRKRGFRTWSRHKIGSKARGNYRCDVVTSLGQPLGSVHTVVGR